MLKEWFQSIIKKCRPHSLSSLFMACTLLSPFNQQETKDIEQLFLSNLTAQGAVIASPSKQDPDYFYHWVRDGAIAMSLVQDWFEQNSASDKKYLLKNYVNWVNQVQHATPNQGYDIFGEPKFYVNARVFDGQWGRPQNDGPALRALTLMRFANALIDKGEHDYVTQTLYNPSLEFEKMGVIKRDLEYTAHHWQEKSVDLWEESMGFHFFTAAVQHKALLEGAKFASQLNDKDAASYYLFQAHQLNAHLTRFLDNKTNRLKASLDAEGPLKTNNIDSAIILGILIGRTDYSLLSKEVDNTVKALSDYFQQNFPINQNNHLTLWGRYPNDTYDGKETQGIGNPWFILTATKASYHYQRAYLLSKKEPQKAFDEIQEADTLLNTLKRFMPNLHMSEQIHRISGKQQGARDLTWSYQSLLYALALREKSIDALEIEIAKPH
jgi:glucoamylase